MARPKNGSSLSIAQLEKLLNDRHRLIEKLGKRRKQLLKELSDVESEIASMNGGSGAGGMTSSGRPKNSQSLVATIESVLLDAGKPLSVGEIVDGVQAAGYRSSSAKFRPLVNQTLIKVKRFSKAGRGVYQLKNK